MKTWQAINAETALCRKLHNEGFALRNLHFRQLEGAQ